MSEDLKNIACESVIYAIPGLVDRDRQQLWLMTLTGGASVGYTLDPYSLTDREQEHYNIYPSFQGPLRQAYVQVFGQVPSGRELLFRPEQAATLATLNSVQLPGGLKEAGAHCYPARLLLDGSKNFQGLKVSLELLGRGTYVVEVGFQVTMLGRIILSTTPI